MARDYSAFSEAYSKARAADAKWAEAMQDQAEGLRAALVNLYAPPKEHWNYLDGKKGGFYVFLFSLDDGPRTFSSRLPAECFLTDYRVIFGIGVTVDSPTQGFPKRIFWQAVAARYQGGVCQFKCLDANGNDTLNSPSFDGPEIFSEYLLMRLEKNLSFDPFEGEKPPGPMGFLNVENR